MLNGLTLTHSNLVWGADIPNIPMPRGFLYLMAILDWASRYGVSWTLSNTLDPVFCLQALEIGLERGEPVIVNTDQGAQFTGSDWIQRLLRQGILISMASRGQALDNGFIERLERPVKYEDVFRQEDRSPDEREHGLTEYCNFYNKARPHSALDNRTPGRPTGPACREPAPQQGPGPLTSQALLLVHQYGSTLRVKDHEDAVRRTLYARSLAAGACAQARYRSI